MSLGSTPCAFCDSLFVPNPVAKVKARYCSPPCRRKGYRRSENYKKYHRNFEKRIRAKKAATKVFADTSRGKALALGFRSGFERTIANDLKSDGIKFGYETLQLPYVIESTYNPDFILPNGIIVEAKGVLDVDSKRKMIAVKKQHPHLDIRFVFMRADQKIPRTKQTHGQWATKNGFIWADGKVPKEWYA